MDFVVFAVESTAAMINQSVSLDVTLKDGFTESSSFDRDLEGSMVPCL